MIANTVIGQDNSSLQTMSTDQLLDLFTLDEQGKGASVATAAQTLTELQESTSNRSSMRAILDSLEELWDEKQYESEYNLENFMKSLT